MEACVRSCIRCKRILAPINAVFGVSVSMAQACVHVWDSFRIKLCLLTNINKHPEHPVHRRMLTLAFTRTLLAADVIGHIPGCILILDAWRISLKIHGRAFRHVKPLTLIAFLLMYRAWCVCCSKCSEDSAEILLWMRWMAGHSSQNAFKARPNRQTRMHTVNPKCSMSYTQYRTCVWIDISAKASLRTHHFALIRLVSRHTRETCYRSRSTESDIVLVTIVSNV